MYGCTRVCVYEMVGSLEWQCWKCGFCVSRALGSDVASVRGLPLLDYVTGRVISSLQFEELVGGLGYQSACCIGVVVMHTLPKQAFDVSRCHGYDIHYMCVGMHMWMYMHLSRG